MASDTWHTGIASFTRSISGLSQLPAEVAQDLAKDITTDLQKKYASGQDPYGKTWPRRKNNYPWPILRKSGKLFNSLEVSVSGGKVIVLRGRGATYGQFHQTGTKHLPVRLIIPINGKGVPTSWNPLFLKRVQARFKKLFRQ